MFKDELGGKITKEFCLLRPKTYAYLMGDDSKKKKIKATKMRLIKRWLMFENYKDSLLNDRVILRWSQQRFKIDCYEMYTEDVNKIAWSSNDDKRLQTFDRVTTYLYRTNAFKVCGSEMMVKNYNKYKWSISMIM